MLSLLFYLNKNAMIDLYEKITTAIKNNDTSYLVTIINTNSKDPVNKIAKMLVYQNGETFGSINNAELEYTLTKDILKEKPLCVIQKEVSVEENKISIIIEPIINPNKLYIIGRGNTALKLSTIAGEAGFNVIAIDDRGDWANKVNHCKCSQTIVSNYKNIADHIDFSSKTYIVIITHNPTHDCEVLKNVITKKTKYIGMIGNENKKNRIFDNLTKLNISDELLSKLHSPIGLNIRSKSSYEIAVSILAELIDVKNKH